MKVKEYRFISDKEPSDRALNIIMNAAIIDVKQKALLAEKKAKKVQLEYLKTMKAKYAKIIANYAAKT